MSGYTVTKCSNNNKVSTHLVRTSLLATGSLCNQNLLECQKMGTAAWTPGSVAHSVAYISYLGTMGSNVYIKISL